MYVHNDKLDWFEHAQDEWTTAVFPAGFALNDPVCAYFQRTIVADKINTYQLGLIDSVTKTSEEYRITFSFEYCSLECLVAIDLRSLTVTMRNPCHPRPFKVFIGKLDWFEYAANEMFTLVVLSGVSDGSGGYHIATIRC
ncbi:hypothetical protein BD626DRAFT_563525 [Schizophyllum amplum]|uniref:Uncharacterized protein n=1 Tax=Schizophyllum amplum TaxID=97359 RepID=A0A550CYH3_9AGAR|nr:hypothetical protein BD626DRAFT_563525 [Auriculariopsis ampla]